MIYIDEPVTKNFTIIAGSTFRFAFRLELNGAPVDLTGWKARFQAGGIGLSTENGGITLNGAAGTGVMMAHPTATREYVLGAFDHQFEFEDPAGEVQTYLVGQTTIVREIAR